MTGDMSAKVQWPLVAMLRRHVPLLIMLGILAAAAGVGAAMLMAPSYTATATILVTPLDGNPYSPTGRGDDLINLETEAQLVSTDAVSKLAGDQLHRSDVTKLRGGVSVAVPPNTQVLNVSFTANDSAGSRDAANAFAKAYLTFRQQRAQAVIDNKLKKLEAQSGRVELALQNATKKAALAGGTQRAFLAKRIAAYTNQLGVIDEQTNDISSTPVSPGQMITPASLPQGPGLQRLLTFGVGGLIAGLLLAGVIAFLREFLDKRLHGPADLENLGIRTLAVVPERAGPTDELPMVTTPNGPHSEAYRRLRAAIVATSSNEQRHTLLVASAGPGGSAMHTSANLAVAMAFAGSATIMIDAGASEPEAARLFGLRPGKGLSDTLINDIDPATLVIHVDPQLRLLPRGSNPEAATHRFSGPLMRRTVAALRRRAELLVINGPSLHDADGQALCALTDDVLLVVTRGVTTRDDLRQACIEAERAGATIIGAVIEAPRRASKKSKERRTAVEEAPATAFPASESRSAVPPARASVGNKPSADPSMKATAKANPDVRDEADEDYWPGLPTTQNDTLVAGPHTKRRHPGERNDGAADGPAVTVPDAETATQIIKATKAANVGRRADSGGDDVPR